MNKAAAAFDRLRLYSLRPRDMDMPSIRASNEAIGTQTRWCQMDALYCLQICTSDAELDPTPR